VGEMIMAQEISSKRVDVSTVVSILPYSISERKPGLIPPEFKIDAVKNGDFELLVVERCRHPVYLDDTRPRLLVPDPSDVVAESIVLDHKKSISLGYEPGVSEPGLDWVSGEFKNDEEGRKLFKIQHAAVLTQMERLQFNWYKALIRIADDDWNKYHMHKFITDLQRTAARTLNVTTKDWMLETQIEESMGRCKFCFTTIHPQAQICFNCHGDQTKDKYSNIVASALTPAVPSVPSVSSKQG
jgi:hypothetical protein